MQAENRKDEVQAFYLNEIIPDLEKRRIFWTAKDLGILEYPVVQIGVDKIQAKTPLGRFFTDFANNSTIHGINHLAAPRRHICEKYSLGFIIFISLILLIFLSLQPWYRYQYEATVISLDTNNKYFNITIPSLTICPINSLNESKFSSVFKRHGINDTAESREFFQFISKVDYSKMNATPLYDNVPAEKWLRVLYDLRSNLKFADSDYFENYIWVSTEHGICVTFANFVSIYSSLEYWFANNFTIVPEVKPENRHYYNFYNLKSHIVMTIKDCKTDYEVEIHYPDEIFLKPQYTLRANSTQHLTVLIDEFNSSSIIRSLKPQQRNCKFLNDGGLKMWPVYTLNMCLLECKYNQIYQACKCYPHFARPMKGIAVCNATQLRCIGSTNPPVYTMKNEHKKCGCFINCNSAFYTTYIKIFELTLDFPSDSVIHLILNLPFKKFIREQIFGWTDFLISVSGACNLLLGASIISLIEIFYYASLRLSCYLNKLRLKKKRKSALAKRILKQQ